MTVGIVFSNGLESILLCDEMLSIMSSDGTAQDSVTKLGVFSGGSYHGGMVGAGDGNLVTGGIKILSAGQLRKKDLVAAEILDGFVEAVRGYAAGKLDADDNAWLEEKGEDARKKAATIPKGERRANFLKSERDRIFQDYDGLKQQQKHNPPVEFLIAAYDSINKIPRAFSIRGIMCEEIHLPHHEIGDGAMAARLYFAESLHGIEPSNLTLPQLAFHVSCAFMKSTIEAGVGGTPRMLLVGEKQAKSLDSSAVAAMTNVCGYYLAGALTRNEARDFAEKAVQVAANADNAATVRGEVGRLSEDLCGRLETTSYNLVTATLPLWVIYRLTNHRK